MVTHPFATHPLAVPHVPSPGSRGFGGGRGNAGAPIGSHLQHQQGSQQAIGTLASTFNLTTLENPNSQPSVCGQLSQPGFVANVHNFLMYTLEFNFNIPPSHLGMVVLRLYFPFLIDASSRAKTNIS